VTWDAGRYESECDFVHERAGDLVDLLDPAPGERVLDVGCGTGHLTAEIDRRADGAIGADSAPDMLATAREKHPGTAFVRADARALPFEAAFDAAFSNATLHWVPEADQPAALESAYRALKPGGRFVAELGGVGNVGRIARALRAELEARGHPADSPWYFPSVGTYAGALEDAGFEVRLARLFDRPTEIEGMAPWLRMFGDSFLAGLDDAEREAVVGAVVERLRGDLRSDGVWYADYRRLRFVAVKAA
jgi:trans-aconitate methyltransferase